MSKDKGRDKPTPVCDPDSELSKKIAALRRFEVRKAKNRRAKRRLRDRKKAKDKMATKILKDRKDKIKLIDDKCKDFLNEIDYHIENERKLYIKYCIEKYRPEGLL